MPVKLNSDVLKSQKSWLKKAMSGRPVHFGALVAGAKNGKFLVSRKPGDVNQKSLKEKQMYEGKGNDAAEASEMNAIKGGFATGVCEGSRGTLKLYVERGKSSATLENFVAYFVSRRAKLKLVKSVQIVPVEQGQMPAVPESDPRDGPPKALDVQKRANDLRARLFRLDPEDAQGEGKDSLRLWTRLEEAAQLGERDQDLYKEEQRGDQRQPERILIRHHDPTRADELLDDVECAIALLESAKQGGDANVLQSVREKVWSGDLDGAEAALDTAAAKAAPGKGGPRKSASAPAAQSTLDDFQRLEALTMLTLKSMNETIDRLIATGVAADGLKAELVKSARSFDAARKEQDPSTQDKLYVANLPLLSELDRKIQQAVAMLKDPRGTSEQSGKPTDQQMLELQRLQQKRTQMFEVMVRLMDQWNRQTQETLRNLRQ